MDCSYGGFYSTALVGLAASLSMTLSANFMRKWKASAWHEKI